ncbi:hypothetical protein MLPM_2669 [Mycobacterium lepromatosis]|uniref:Uncharacterized protein n=1 Tax=Mycobacterium lepromatosis TaxID=480418 RepID=A0A0F4ENQ1_9MYCO|nr:hypothetical protein MLPM_2669 [Mycobacterium lepromatosis]
MRDFRTYQYTPNSTTVIHIAVAIQLTKTAAISPFRLRLAPPRSLLRKSSARPDKLPDHMSKRRRAFDACKYQQNSRFRLIDSYEEALSTVKLLKTQLSVGELGVTDNSNMPDNQPHLNYTCNPDNSYISVDCSG